MAPETTAPATPPATPPTDPTTPPASPPALTPPGSLLTDPPPAPDDKTPPADPPPNPDDKTPPNPGDDPPQEETDDAPKGAPESYADFTLPEGVTVDAERTEAFKGLAKELNLTQEQAQQLVTFEAAKMRELLEAPYKLWFDTQEQWRQQIMADPEIGGDKLAANIAASSRLFQPSADNPLIKTTAEGQALTQALAATGAANHPDIVRFFVRLGQSMGEGSFVAGRAPQGDKPSAADLLFAKPKA